MKSKISYSTYANLLTGFISLVLFAGCIATVREKYAFSILLTVYLFLFVSSMLWGPCYIKADERYLVLGSLCKKKKILMSNIESVELFQPTMGALRICGSGGFMGYWGIFREGDIGKYYAFYGKASDCFLVRLKNGDKYVLGCNQPAQMVEYIQSQIEK